MGYGSSKRTTAKCTRTAWLLRPACINTLMKNRKTAVFATYSGRLIHSRSYKYPLSHHEGASVLVFGGGETASDIAAELDGVASVVDLSIPNGQWFTPKYIPNDPSVEEEPFDHFSSRLRTWAAPPRSPLQFSQVLLERAQGFSGHGVEAWRSPAPLFRQFLNKSSHVLAHVHDGRIGARPAVASVSGRTVTFVDGTSRDYDEVILCTGYHRTYPFLEEPQPPVERLYKLIFDVEDPSLCFVGGARPVVTSIPLMTEIQCKFLANVVSGRAILPDTAAMRRDAEAEAAYRAEFFGRTSGRLDGLVEPDWYFKSVASVAGFAPSYFKVLLRHPRLWWEALTAPAHSTVILLNEADRDAHVMQTLTRYRPRRSMKRAAFNRGRFIFAKLISIGLAWRILPPRWLGLPSRS